MLKNAGAGNSFDMYVKKLNTIVESMINEPLTPLTTPKGGGAFDLPGQTPQEQPSRSPAEEGSSSAGSTPAARKSFATRRPSPLSGGSSSSHVGTGSKKEDSPRNAAGVSSVR